MNPKKQTVSLNEKTVKCNRSSSSLLLFFQDFETQFFLKSSLCFTKLFRNNRLTETPVSLCNNIHIPITTKLLNTQYDLFLHTI